MKKLPAQQLEGETFALAVRIFFVVMIKMVGEYL